MEVEVTKVGRVGLIKGENFGQCLVYIHFIYKMYEYNNQTMYTLHLSVSLFFFIVIHVHRCHFALARCHFALARCHFALARCHFVLARCYQHTVTLLQMALS